MGGQMGGQMGGGDGRVHVAREGAVTPPPPLPLISVTWCLVCSHTVVVAAARVVAVARYTGDLELFLEHLCRYHQHHQSTVIITLQLKPCNQPQTLSPSQIAPPQDR